MLDEGRKTVNIVESALFDFLSLNERQIAFLGTLEGRNFFGPKNKVSSHEKLSDFCFFKGCHFT